MTTTVANMLDKARHYLGYVEGPNNDTIFGKRFGINHQPWCDMSVCCIGEDAGARDIIGWFAYTPSHANWFKERKQWGTTPRVGAIVFFQWPGMGRIAHVGIVEEVRADGSIVTLEGNTDVAGGRTGGRYMRKVRKANIAGYGYPAYAAAAPVKKAPAPVKKAAPAPVKKAVPAPAPRPAPKRSNPYKVPVLTKARPALKASGQKTTAEVKYVQWAIGAVDDGKWGAQTTQALRAFQAKNKIEVDGNVGPQTLGVMAKVRR